MISVTHLKRGLDLPLTGSPKQSIVDGPAVKQVALVGDDYVGMIPTMAVAEGDPVALGQLLFTDKKTPGVRFTAPATGVVTAIHRGAKRKFESLVIDLAESADSPPEETFEVYADDNLTLLDHAPVRDQLLASGLWTALNPPSARSPRSIVFPIRYLSRRWTPTHWPPTRPWY